MKFNIDRMCELAGFGNTRTGRMLNEASNRSLHDDNGLSGEAEYRYGKNQLNEESEDFDIDLDEDADDDLEEMIEIDEVMLVQELRRAKKLMNESKRRKLKEMNLKKIIDDEVRSTLKDLNLTSGWVYGENKPRRSRAGYVNHGTYLKGLGFK